MWDWTENQVTLAFIRHGKTKANEERRYLGRTDESLSEKGREELAAYRQKGRYPEITHLFASPMKRCLETAGILYPDRQPIIIHEWEEMDFGKFEYMNYEELKGNAQYQAWLDSQGALPFPGGECREDFISRCRKGFLRMCDALHQSYQLYQSHQIYQMEPQKKNQKGETPVRAGMIVHGGTIMALLCKPDGSDYFDYQVPNGGGYVCRLTEPGNQIKMGGLKEL